MRHHYIPEFLLKVWTESTLDNKVEVFRLDLAGVPSNRYSPRHTGYEKDLYALSRDQVAGLDAQHVETKILKPVDNDAAVVLKKLLLGRLNDLTKAENVNWVIFLMSLRVRRPEFVNFLKSDEPKKLIGSAIKNPKKHGFSSENPDPHAVREFIEKKEPGLTDNLAMVHFGDFITDRDDAMEIGRMTWSLHHFRNQKHHLLLSDDPLIFTEKSIDHPDLIIMLPVSPDKVFIATKTIFATRWIRQHRAKDVVRYINEWSVFQAKKRIFACDRSQHRFILNRINKRHTQARKQKDLNNQKQQLIT